MGHRMVTGMLLIGLFFSVLTLGEGLGDYRLPDNQQGYEPIQPIAYSHRLHAGELNIDCMFCHQGAEKTRHAGIPSADTCYTCHRFITARHGEVLEEKKLAAKENRPSKQTVSSEIKKIYEALGLDNDLKKDPTKTPRPIEWVRVHNLPDFVFFDHRTHVSAGVSCQKCHGPIESMERVRQIETLSMGWCIDCHRNTTGKSPNGRKLSPSTDCAGCHY